MNGLRRTDVRRGIEGNSHNGAKTLRDHTLRALEIEFGQIEVFGDHTGMLLESLAHGGLAGSETFWREARAAAAAGKANGQRSRRIRVGQETPVRIRDSDRGITHRAKHPHW